MKKQSRNFLPNHILNKDADLIQWNKYLEQDIFNKYLSIGYQEFVNINFNSILQFIGKHCYVKNKVCFRILKNEELSDIEKYKNAYKVIKYEVRYYYKNGISGKEIKAIRNNFTKLIGKEAVLKIPYKVHYIFATVYDLLDAIKIEGIEIPAELVHFCNLQYSKLFYCDQILAYQTCCEIHQAEWETDYSEAKLRLSVGLQDKLEGTPFNKLFN